MNKQLIPMHSEGEKNLQASSDAKTRHKSSRRRREKYIEMHSLPNGGHLIKNFLKTTKNLSKRLNNLSRKQPGSNNMERDIARISSIIFSLIESAKIYKATDVNFDDEIDKLNDFVISILDRNITTFHQGTMPKNRKGEALLGCYLNCMITLTTLKEDLVFGDKPYFTWNPLTNERLEIDIQIENFRLAFEFQGEHHFTDRNAQEKDGFKVQSAHYSDIVLIPFSMAQLHSDTILEATANKLMDFVGVRDKINDEALWNKTNIKFQYLKMYLKAIHRIYLCHTIFRKALQWLDEQSRIYVSNRLPKNPNSATKEAISYELKKPMLSINKIYLGLGYVKRLTL